MGIYYKKKVATIRQPMRTQTNEGKRERRTEKNIKERDKGKERERKGKRGKVFQVFPLCFNYLAATGWNSGNSRAKL